MSRVLVVFVVCICSIAFCQFQDFGSGFDSETIRGIPFSADVTMETTHVLSDGNRIHREFSGKFCRDSEGRTRSEKFLPEFPGDEPTDYVLIRDLVQHVVIDIFMKRKTAVIMLEPQVVRNPPRPIQQQAVHSTTSTRTEQIGTMNIEGFTATGSRFINTTEAGTVGNDRPLVSISETWKSEELGEILLRKTDDPQHGQMILRFSNIRRGEPDQSLFQIPPGFTIVDQSNKH